MMVLMDTGAGGILAAVGITGLPAYIIAIAAGLSWACFWAGLPDPWPPGA